MFGSVLRELRKTVGWTQVQLAQASGLAHNYISELERGDASNPSRQTIKRLAEALAIPESMLTTELLAEATVARSTEAENQDVPEPALSWARSRALGRGTEVNGAPVQTAEGEATTSPGHQYRGYRVFRPRDDGSVYCEKTAAQVDDNWLPQHHWEQSTGYEWGYHGRGPLTLGYDLLAYEVGEELAAYHVTQFAAEVVARFPTYVSKVPGAHLEWTHTGTEIRTWLSAQPPPSHIRPYFPPNAWRMRADGRLCTIVYAQFLLDTRYAFELEAEVALRPRPEYVIKNKHIYEEQLQPVAEGVWVWQYLREVESKEVTVPHSIPVS